MKKILTVLSLFLFCNLFAQNTGDIAIIGMNTDNPDMALIVALADIPGNTEIYFSDNEWNDTAWDLGEGFSKYTVNSSGLSVGQVVELNFTDGLASDGGTLLPDGTGISLGTSGDHLYMYLGTDKENPTTFLFAVVTKGITFAANRLNNTGLVQDETAIGFVNSTDNVMYNGTRTGSVANLKSAISKRDLSWERSSSPFTFDGSNFNLTPAVEPENHPTNFAADSPTFSEINLSWVDAVGTTVPDYYMIGASTTSFADITAPVDGAIVEDDNDFSDGNAVFNLNKESQILELAELSAQTTYYFKIYGYTNFGDEADYKTDSPVAEVELTTAAEPGNLPVIVINEFLADPASGDDGDANGDGTRDSGDDEFVEFVNLDGDSVNIGGFSFEDGYGIRHIFAANTMVPDSGSFVLFGGGTPTGIPGMVFTADSGVIGLNNGGDVLTLKDGDGNTIVTYTYGSEGGDNQSLARNPDLTGDFVKHSTITSNPVNFSPGSYNTTGNEIPVELTAFTAVVIENGVKLNWATATELNNYGFEIERKADNVEWTKVGFVNGAGNSTEKLEYSFTDKKVSAGKISYRLKQIDFDGTSEYSNVVEISIGLPEKFELAQNFPNPFNPSTNIKFSLPETANVKLVVFNTIGEEVAVLANSEFEAGKHEVKFSANKLTSGIYFYRIEAGNNIVVKKMMLLK